MRYGSYVMALVLCIFALALPRSARAEDDGTHSFSLHTRVGGTAFLNDPQDQIYTVGVGMRVQPMFRLVSLPADLELAAGPSLEATYFPRINDNGLNAGLLWDAGGSLRLQGRRDMKDGTGFWSGASPYLEVSALAANTGNLFRPAFDATLGLEGALDDQKQFWLGAWVGYNQTFQTSGTQGDRLLDKSDPQLFQAGLSLSFDLVKPRVVEHTRVEERVVVHTVKVEVPARMAERAPARLEQIETVYFNWDSSNLRWESNDKLDRMIKLFAAHPNARITIQGHASLDGNYDHNVALSARRTAAVVAYLTAHGVSADRLISEHFGPDVPAPRGNNRTQEGKERNRRVEFQVSFVLNETK